VGSGKPGVDPARGGGRRRWRRGWRPGCCCCCCTKQHLGGCWEGGGGGEGRVAARKRVVSLASRLGNKITAKAVRSFHLKKA